MKLKPDLAGIVLNRGIAYARSGDYDRALPDLDQAVGTNPNNAFALFNRGMAKKALGDGPGADADIAKARSIQPDIGQ